MAHSSPHPPSSTRLLTVRVKRKRLEAQDICSLELVDPEGRDLPPFSAGSHIDLHLPNGLVRQYSLCNSPTERPIETSSYLVAVLRDAASRGGSQAVHELVHEGNTIQISEPRNHFELVPARHTVLLGGGIGITPILCMAERLAQTGASFELHYCARSAQRAAFHARLAACAFSDRVRFHFDDGAPEQKLDLHAALGAPASDRHLFVCGPNGYMAWVIGGALGVGWAEGRIHREYFAGNAVETGGDGAFTVKISSTGATFTVARDQTLADVLAANGLAVPTSCEQGVCGTCLTRVLEGDIDHRDMFLTDEERALGDRMTPCVSRAKAGCKTIVLDL